MHLTLTLLLALTGDVLDVDPVAGPHASIFDAVAAAQDGDVVRVADGSYGYFGVFGKSLRIVAVNPGAVIVQGAVRVQTLAAGQEVVLHGLQVHGLPGTEPAGLRIVGNAGAVRVEACCVYGPFHGAEVTDSDDVVFSDTLLDGRTSGPSAGDGLVATRSSVTLFDCSALGGSFQGQGSSGGSGIRLIDSDVLLHGSSAWGGSGGSGSGGPATCSDGSPGGDGIRGIGGSLRLLDASLTGGPGGFAGGFPGWGCVDGAPGEPFSTTGTVVSQLAGPALVLSHAALADEGVSLALQADGLAGAPLLIVVGPETGRVLLPAYVGDLHVGGPSGAARRALLGAAPVNTSLQLPLLAPLGIETWTLQVVQLQPGGRVVLGPTRSLTVLDTAW